MMAMTKQEWIEVIENNMDAAMDAMEAAQRDAIEAGNRRQAFQAENIALIRADGLCEVVRTTPGTLPAEVRDGEAMVLRRYTDWDEPADVIEEMVNEQPRVDLLEILDAMRDEVALMAEWA